MKPLSLKIFERKVFLIRDHRDFRCHTLLEQQVHYQRGMPLNLTGKVRKWFSVWYRRMEEALQGPHL